MASAPHEKEMPVGATGTTTTTTTETVTQPVISLADAAQLGGVILRRLSIIPQQLAIVFNGDPTEPYYWEETASPTETEATATTTSTTTTTTTGVLPTTTAAHPSTTHHHHHTPPPVTKIITHNLHWFALRTWGTMESVGEFFSEIFGLQQSRYAWAMELQNREDDAAEAAEIERERQRRWKEIAALNAKAGAAAGGAGGGSSAASSSSASAPVLPATVPSDDAASADASTIITRPTTTDGEGGAAETATGEVAPV